MAIVLTVNGQAFDYPEQGDQRWGPDATGWASAVTSGMLQKAGGLFQLLAEVDFGTSYGVKSLYYKSRTANIASAGQMRLARTDTIVWRNNANSADLALAVNASDQLTFNGNTFSPYITAISDTATIDLSESSGVLSADIKNDSITNAMINSAAAIAYSKLSLTGSIVNADINASAAIAYSKLNLSGSIVNADISASAAIAYSKLNLSGSIVNADINASAAIALTKLATVTASRALESSAGGVIQASAVTSTELGYLTGVSSAIQTQLNAKVNLSGGTMSGLLVLSGDPVTALGAATKQYVDNAIQGLDAKQSVVVATTANGTLATAFANGQSVDGVTLTTNDRILIKNQSAPEENGIYVVQGAGAPVRASDANTWDEYVAAYVFVEQGTTNADTGWLCTANPGGALGVNALPWVQFSSSGSITAGNGLTKTGLTLDVNIDNSTIDFTSNNLRVKPLGITNAEISASAAIAYSKLALTGSILNADINASAAIAYSKLAAMTSASILLGNGSNVPTVTAVTGDVTISNTGVTAIAAGVIVNADISASAAIAFTKMAAMTASRAVVSDGSGFLVPATTTATEIGYVNGVTSAIQTQLNAKMANPMTTGGDVIYGGASGVPTRLANGSSGQVLTSQGGTSAPVWAVAGTPGTQTITGNYTIVAGDANSILFVSTAAARQLTLPTPTAGFKITIKDKTGQAQTNNITVVRAASEQIEGVAASKIFQTNWGCWTLVSDGTDWFII